MMKITFKDINQWHLIFLALIALEITLGFVRNDGWWEHINAIITIWVLYQIGRFSLDREFEIKLNKAIDEMESK